MKKKLTDKQKLNAAKKINEDLHKEIERVRTANLSLLEDNKKITDASLAAINSALEALNKMPMPMTDQVTLRNTQALAAIEALKTLIRDGGNVTGQIIDSNEHFRNKRIFKFEVSY